ncbi:LOW QUALITY PROTEIN: relaxin receptor 2 [Leptosomus discolor]
MPKADSSGEMPVESLLPYPLLWTALHICVENPSKRLHKLLHISGGDCDGWASIFDMVHGKTDYLDSSETFTQESLFPGLYQYPEGCSCMETELECALLKSVPLVSSNVTLLSLTHNQITSLQDEVLSKCTKVKRKFLQHNCIQTISRKAFFGLRKLQKLHLSHKCITSLKPGVRRDLHKLKWLPLAHSKEDKELCVFNDSLTQAPGSQLLVSELAPVAFGPGFTEDFEGNHIKALTDTTFLECNALTVLFLHGNQIHLLPANTFSSLKDLVELDLCSNMITELPCYLFKDMKYLQKLNLSFNPLSHLSEDHIESLQQLQSLYLEMIEILNINRRMFQRMRNLSHMFVCKIKEGQHCMFISLLLAASKSFAYCFYALHMQIWTSLADGISSFEGLLANNVLRAFMWVIACVTCFGNPVTRMRSERRADCLMGVYSFFIGVFDVKYCGQYKNYSVLWIQILPCYITGSTAMPSTEGSVLLLTYLTLGKYLVIVFPFSNICPGKQQTVVIFLSVWIAGFTTATIAFGEEFWGNYRENGVCFPLNRRNGRGTGGQGMGVTVCSSHIVSAASSSSGDGLLTLSPCSDVTLLVSIIIVFSQVSMFVVQKTAFQTSEIRSHIRKGAAVANQYYFVVFTDAICWIPVFASEVLSLFQVEIPDTVLSWIVIFVLPIHSALNPILCTLSNTFFKEKLKQSLDSHRKAIFKNDENILATSVTWTDDPLTHSSSFMLGFLKNNS